MGLYCIFFFVVLFLKKCTVPVSSFRLLLSFLSLSSSLISPLSSSVCSLWLCHVFLRTVVLWVLFFLLPLLSLLLLLLIFLPLSLFSTLPTQSQLPKTSKCNPSNIRRGASAILPPQCLVRAHEWQAPPVADPSVWLLPLAPLCHFQSLSLAAVWWSPTGFRRSNQFRLFRSCSGQRSSRDIRI